MKLYNVIIIHDVYCVANDPEEARAAVRAAIKEDFAPTEQTALETRFESNVRASWRDQKPFVGNDISDEDFDKLVKGSTTIEMFKKLYTKEK